MNRVGLFVGLCVFVLAGWFVGTEIGHGQETDQAAGSPPESKPADSTKPQEMRMTPEQIQVRIAQLEQDKSLDSDIQKKALDLWKEALATANLSTLQDTRIQRLIQQREEAPKLIETIRAQLAEPAVEPTLKIDEGAPLSEYEQGLAKAQSQFAEVRKLADDYETRLKDRADRRARSEKAAAQAGADLEKLNAESEPTADEHPEVGAG